MIRLLKIKRTLVFLIDWILQMRNVRNLKSELLLCIYNVNVIIQIIHISFLL